MDWLTGGMSWLSEGMGWLSRGFSRRYGLAQQGVWVGSAGVMSWLTRGMSCLSRGHGSPLGGLGWFRRCVGTLCGGMGNGNGLAQQGYELWGILIGSPIEDMGPLCGDMGRLIRGVRWLRRVQDGWEFPLRGYGFPLRGYGFPLRGYGFPLRR